MKCSSRPSCLAAFLAFAFLIGMFAIPVNAQEKEKKKYTDEDVSKAIKKAREYLWSKYKEPPANQVPEGLEDFKGKNKNKDEIEPPSGKNIILSFPPDNEKVGHYEVGFNSLILYALLASGDKLDDSESGKKIKLAIDAIVMKNAVIAGDKLGYPQTYSTGPRIQLLAALPGTYSVEITYPKRGKVKVTRGDLIKKDAIRLMQSIAMPTPVTDLKKIVLPPDKDMSKMDKYGGWSYISDYKFPGGPGGFPDQSNTHFGFLGIWAAAKADPELVPKEIWKALFYHYYFSQDDNAGWWSYQMQKGEYPSNQYPCNMTTAAIANMLIAAEYLFADKFVGCGVKEMDATYQKVNKGIEWVSGEMVPEKGSFKNGEGLGGYPAYTLERAALATGYKFIGDKDWYKIGINSLLASQKDDGSWDGSNDFRNGGSSDVKTALNLIFLARGQLPLIMNRLWYDGDWNNRPSALGRLAKWASKTFESEINWQIVTMQTNPEQWHDTPVLLISGSIAPKFTDADIVKLRDFAYQGGTILSVVECNGSAFNKGMKDAYRKMFPKYELEKITDENPLAAYRKVQGKLPVMSEINNRVRPLAIHVEEDIVRDWQTNASSTRKVSFDAAANIVAYIGGGTTLRNRGTSPWPDKPTTWPEKKVKMVRLAYSGNSDPEPLAWERLKWKLADEGTLTLDVGAEQIAIKDLPASQAHMAVLTGTQTLKLEPGDAEAIKKYVDAGGLLIVDAAGGSQKFEESARKLIGDAFGGADKIETLTTSSPLLASLPKELKIKYRSGATRGSSKDLRLNCIMNNGKPGVVISGDDLTAGILDVKARCVDGYIPEVAYELGKAMVIYASTQPQPAAAAAESTPASTGEAKPAEAKPADAKPAETPTPTEKKE